MTINHWPHSPLHMFNSTGSYFITCATLHKQKIFTTPEELNHLQNQLFECALKYEWRLEAWAIFANHYHIIAQSPKDPHTLKKFIKHFHSVSAIAINKSQKTPGRQVWHEYWDTFLSYENSYLARLNYVMNNPVKHKLVENAEVYPWCSMCWFKINIAPSRGYTVLSYKYDELEIDDDYD